MSLRMKYESDWRRWVLTLKTKTLSKICNYRKERVNVSTLSHANYISTENMLPSCGGVTLSSKLPTKGSVSLFRKGDILLSNIRPYFKKVWFADRDGGCSNDVLVLHANVGINPKYIYYVITSDSFIAYDVANSKGTKMPRGDKNAIMQYEIPDITVQEQNQIADSLSCLDEKIELNKKINHHLEEIAQSIFKAWFVNFKFHNGKRPANWQKSNLTNIASYLNGLAMQKFRPNDSEKGLPVLKIKELRQGSFDKSSDLCSSTIKSQYIVHDGDIIFSWSGSLLVDFWTGGIGGLNQHLFKVTSNKYDKWFYYSWTKYYLNEFVAQASAKATTMGHIKRDSLEKAQVLIPTKIEYEEIGSILKPIYDQIIAKRLENNKLEKLRDTLLPKLLSGQLV